LIEKYFFRAFGRGIRVEGFHVLVLFVYHREASLPWPGSKKTG
jgi:hypothetical protein